jgi:hypothetical protein
MQTCSAYNGNLFAVTLTNICHLKNIFSKHSQVRSYFEDLSTRNPFLKLKFNLDSQFRIYKSISKSLPTSKKVCQVKKDFISYNLA